MANVSGSDHSAATYTITRAYSGADETPFTSWETAREGNLITDDAIERGIVYKDSDGIFVFSAALLLMSGSTTDSSHFVWLTAHPSARHNGTAGSGVVLQSASQSGIDTRDEYTRVEWLEIDVSGQALRVKSGSDNSLYANLLIHDSNSVIFANAVSGATLRNSIIYNNGGDGIELLDAGTDVNIENCTIYGSPANGILVNTGTTATITNTISVGNDSGSSDFNCAGTCNGSNNMSSDGTGPATGLQSAPATLEDLFVDCTDPGYDFHLGDPANHAADDNGLDLFSSFINDIDDETRPTGTGTWDIGADEINGLIGHWKFDEGSGQTAADSSGSGNDGTLGTTAGADLGDPTWTCVTGGYALTFDGDDDEVGLPSVIIGDKAAWTITAWVKTSDTSTKRTIYSEGDSGGERYFFLYVSDAGTPPPYAKYYTTDGSSYWISVEDSTNIEDNEFHHVAMVQRSFGERELFVDAQSDGINYDNHSAPTNNMATIGYLRASTWDTASFLGTIDDVRIYDRALSTAEISALAASPPANCGETTTLGDGSDPGNLTVAPGSTNQYLDQFTFVTSSGSDSVDALTVTTANTAAIASMQIWNNDFSTQYFATVSAPSGNDWSFSGGTAIPVGASSTPFRIRFTAEDHGTLAEGTYAVTGTVTSFTSTNSQAGSDTDSATITVDNTPPSDATWGTITPGDQQIQLNWTNPGSDFNKVVILRRAGSAVGDAPSDGTEYNVNDPIGSSTVRYVGNLETFTDTGLTNGTNYYYKIFAYDDYINYASGAATGPHRLFPVICRPMSGWAMCWLTITAANRSHLSMVAVLPLFLPLKIKTAAPRRQHQREHRWVFTAHTPRFTTGRPRMRTTISMTPWKTSILQKS
jgi:hypothetical protein